MSGHSSVHCRPHIRMGKGINYEYDNSIVTVLYAL